MIKILTSTNSEYEAMKEMFENLNDLQVEIIEDGDIKLRVCKPEDSLINMMWSVDNLRDMFPEGALDNLISQSFNSVSESFKVRFIEKAYSIIEESKEDMLEYYHEILETEILREVIGSIQMELVVSGLSSYNLPFLFDSRGQEVLHPWYDESGTGYVNPIIYYGECYFESNFFGRGFIEKADTFIEEVLKFDDIKNNKFLILLVSLYDKAKLGQLSKKEFEEATALFWIKDKFKVGDSVIINSEAIPQYRGRKGNIDSIEGDNISINLGSEVKTIKNSQVELIK